MDQKSFFLKETSLDKNNPYQKEQNRLLKRQPFDTGSVNNGKS